MKARSSTDLIDVQALRVGMFVHLDLSWLSHPFPLSSFRISTGQQIATIRSLGLATVRWSRQDSDPTVDPAEPVEPADPAAAGPDTVPRAEVGAAPVPAAADEPPAPAVPADVQSVTEGTGEKRSQAEQQRLLARQRAARQVCEQQYAEASSACRQAMGLVMEKPQEARAQAEALCRAIVEKMMGEPDVCIRMLAGGAGDKASMHAMNVGVIALLMGRCFGFAAEEMQDLGVGALLHDVGKLDLPPRLRHRDESFTPSEQRMYMEHVELGLVQARRMGLSAAATAVISQHHEHADGSGFPHGLNTDRMTMAARVVALVNRYDNLCNPHLLARALTPHESLSLLFAQGRTKFDTSILGAFIKMMGVYPPGSIVQLTDDRYGLVVAVNSARPLKPSVLVHERDVLRSEALVLDLETTPGLGIRRSIRPQQLPPPALDYLAPSQRIAYYFEPAAPVEDEV